MQERRNKKQETQGKNGVCYQITRLEAAQVARRRGCDSIYKNQDEQCCQRRLGPTKTSGRSRGYVRETCLDLPDESGINVDPGDKEQGWDNGSQSGEKTVERHASAPALG